MFYLPCNFEAGSGHKETSLARKNLFNYWRVYFITNTLFYDFQRSVQELAGIVFYFLTKLVPNRLLYSSDWGFVIRGLKFEYWVVYFPWPSKLWVFVISNNNNQTGHSRRRIKWLGTSSYRDDFFYTCRYKESTKIFNWDIRVC